MTVSYNSDFTPRYNTLHLIINHLSNWYYTKHPGNLWKIILPVKLGLGVDEVLVGQKLQYYIGLIRIIWLMLFIKADVPDMAIGIYFSKYKKKETLIYWAIKFIGFMRLIGIIGLIRGIYSLIVFFWSLLFSYLVSCLLRKELFTVACFLVVEVVKIIIEAVFLPFFI